jgi:hypothetical protein
MALLGLNFQPDLGVQVAIHHRFGQPVNFFLIHGLKEFFLLVSEGRCKFQLSEITVGLLLQAILGGVAAYFRPQRILDRVFKFLVPSKNVGFHVYKLRSFSCAQYQLFFNLWESYSSIYGAMEVRTGLQTGFLNIRIFSNRKKRS